MFASLNLSQFLRTFEVLVCSEKGSRMPFRAKALVVLVLKPPHLSVKLSIIIIKSEKNVVIIYLKQNFKRMCDMTNIIKRHHTHLKWLSVSQTSHYKMFYYYFCCFSHSIYDDLSNLKIGIVWTLLYEAL